MMPSVLPKPAPLSMGVFAAGLALLATLVEGYFWIDIYTDLIDLVPERTADDPDFTQSVGIYRNFLIVVVIASVALALVAAAGAVTATTGRNAGRVLLWSAGGVAVAWHLCCSGYTLMIRAMFAAAVADANRDNPDTPQFHPEDYFAMWKVDAAVLTGFAAGIVTLSAIVLVAQGSVNRYFRALRGQDRPGYGYQVPPPYRPGW